MMNRLTRLMCLCIFILCFFNLAGFAESACQASFNYTQKSGSQIINFTNSTSIPSVQMNSFWDFGDNKLCSEANPIHNYGSYGIFNVSLIVNDGQGSTDKSCNSITINSSCQADFSFGVMGHDVFFINNSTGTTNFTEYTWDYSIIASTTQTKAQNPAITFPNPGTYNVCLTLIDSTTGCNSTICKLVTIKPLPNSCKAAFSFQIDSSSNTFSFTNQSTGTSTAVVYNWTFGDGTISNDENPVHTYSQSGQYKICLFLADSKWACHSEDCQNVSFFQTPNHHNSLKGISSATTIVKSDLNHHSVSNLVHFPNPFNNFSTIQYQLSDDAEVTIGLYDNLGNKLLHIFHDMESKGIQSHDINADQLRSGIYFVKIIVNGELFTRRITILK